jgi:hypothetical protein
MPRPGKDETELETKLRSGWRGGKIDGCCGIVAKRGSSINRWSDSKVHDSSSGNGNDSIDADLFSKIGTVAYATQAAACETSIEREKRKVFACIEHSPSGERMVSN